MHSSFVVTEGYGRVLTRLRPLAIVSGELIVCQLLMFIQIDNILDEITLCNVCEAHYSE